MIASANQWPVGMDAARFVFEKRAGDLLAEIAAGHCRDEWEIILFGQEGARPRLVAVVDLIDNQVADVVPAERW